MDISLIDKNLRVDSRSAPEGTVWFDASKPPFSLHGFGEPFRRLPEKIAAGVSEGVLALHANTAGGRVRFYTDAGYICIKAVMPWACLMPHMALTGSAGFDLYRSGRFAAPFIPPSDIKTGYESTVRLPAEGAECEINFPLYSPVSALWIGLPADAELRAPRPYRHALPAVYYGSSITQGGCASRPGNSYQAIVSRTLDLDYINLGFSGSAKAEPAMAEYIASLDMSVFVCDYDHNAPDAEYLGRTHWPLYEAIRARHPRTPVIFASKPDAWNDPGGVRRDIVRATCDRARAGGDKNVCFIDGGLFFGGDRDCTVDGCHPNDLGFALMAGRFAEVLSGLVGR